MTHFHDALACAERALALARDLDKSRSPGDLAQIASGLRRELDCAIQRLSDGLDDLAVTATGDRPGKVRNDALATGQQAARLVTRPGSKRAEVLLALYRFGDQTDYEIQTRLSMDQNTERPRRVELVDAHLVAPAVFAGGHANTKLHNGRQWQVWRITTAGAEVAARLLGTEPTSGSEVSRGAPQSLF